MPCKRCLWKYFLKKNKQKKNIKTQFFIWRVYSTIRTHTHTDFRRCFPSPSAAKRRPVMAERRRAGAPGGGVKFCYSCSSEFCRNLADHCGDLYVCGFDMKLLRGSSGVCLSTCLPLKWAWLFSLCSHKAWRPHFSALKGADGRLARQTGLIPSFER